MGKRNQTAFGPAVRVGRKYGNRHVEVDGIAFDSVHEARCYQDLKMREHCGDISGLRLQVPFELQPGFKDATGKRHRPISYVADFVYQEGGVTVVSDSKGLETREFKIKYKLFLFRYPEIRFEIVKKEDRRAA